MEDRQGQQLGNYRLIRRIGEGGFAEVYLGEHLYLGTQAAIKILYAQLASDDMEQFRSEARTIALLEHPNIVRVLDFGVDGKIPFLVLGYAPNGSLRQHHPKGVPLPLETIVTYVKQVADALQYAHDQRVIHRDIKPENMLLGRRNEVLLTDFGIALVTQSSRYQGTRDVVGTVAYMAPEQIQGKPRPASDQYALGVVVYEWLSGVRPFHGSFTEIAVQHTLAPPPPLYEKIPTIAPNIEQVVMTALAKDPKERFASMQAFARALEQAAYQTEREPYRSFASTDQRPQSGTPSPGTLPTLVATPARQSPPSTTDAPPPTNTTNTVSSGIRSSKQGISRRAILMGIAGLAIAGGGLTWLTLSQKLSTTTDTIPTATSVPKPLPTRTTTTPVPSTTNTPIVSLPVGTVFSIYRGHSSYIYGVTWASLDGQRIASASLDTTVQVWNPGTGKAYFIYRHSKAVNDVKSSHDKQYIASAGEDSVVQVRNASTDSTLLIYRNHSDAVNTVQWSPDDTRIVSASRDRTVQVWNAATGASLLTYRGHTDEVWAAAWSLDGQRVVSASADGTAQVCDANTGATLITYRGHTATVRSVSWSPDGQRIATASDDLTVQVWDASTGKTLLIYRGHSGLLRTVEWSHDGKRIVSGARDATAQIWDATTGATLFVYRGHSNTVFDAQWSPDGTRIASGSTDTTVQVWQAT